MYNPQSVIRCLEFTFLSVKASWVRQLYTKDQIRHWRGSCREILITRRAANDVDRPPHGSIILPAAHAASDARGAEGRGQADPSSSGAVCRRFVS